MTVGFVLINSASAKEQHFNKELQKIKEIVELHPLFGEFDFIVKIEVEDYQKLTHIVVNKIRLIDGVVNTRTLTGIKF